MLTRIVLAARDYSVRNWRAEFPGDARALAVALPGQGRIAGLLAAFRSGGADGPAFGECDRAVLESIAPKLGACIEHSLRVRRAEAASSRALFERLDGEVARTKRSHGKLAVLECAVAGVDASAAAAG